LPFRCFVSLKKSGEKNYYQQILPLTMAQPYMGAPMMFGDYPAQCTCPQCGKQVVTRVEKKAGLLAWLICGILFFTFMWFCCFIPFCVDACKVSIIFI